MTRHELPTSRSTLSESPGRSRRSLITPLLRSSILSRIASKLGVCVAVILGIFIILFGWSQIGKTAPTDMKWGVTYSTIAARELGLDSREAYKEIVQDLKPNRLRLVAYWSEIEKKAGSYDYSDLDYQVGMAEEAGIPYVIAIGKKVPRYPECFIPEWANKLGSLGMQENLLTYLEKTIRRYDGKAHLAMWQVENEPYFEFGVCPPLNTEYLNQEIDLTKQLTNKPIMMTDSGEGSMWLRASSRADVFGNTLYRSVINDKTGKVFTHFIPPWVYSLRARIAQTIHPNVNNVVVAELQAEPWGSPLREKNKEFTDLTLSHQKFIENIGFTQSVGFSENYLWGVEWWYFQKQQRGNSEFWNTGKQLFATGEVR